MFRNHASRSQQCYRDVSSPCLERDDRFCYRGGSSARHTTRVACPRSRPIFNTQRRCRLQQAPCRRRSLLHIFVARLLQGEALQIPPRSSRSRRAGGRKHGQQPPRLGIERHRQADGWRHRWQHQRLSGQRNGSDSTRNGWTSRVGNAGTEGSSRAID